MAKQWFKARLLWASALMKLPDAQAGKVIKAIYRFETEGEEATLSGSAGMLLDIALHQLKEDEIHEADVSAARSAAGSRGGRGNVKSFDDPARAEALKQCFLQNYSREATTREIVELLRIEKEFRFHQDLTDELILISAQNGARNPIAYIRKSAADCDDKSIRTLQDYEENEYLLNVIHGKYNPEGLTQDEALKRYDEANERRKAHDIS